jgi:hypothetical protein
MIDAASDRGARPRACRHATSVSATRRSPRVPTSTGLATVPVTVPLLESMEVERVPLDEELSIL